MIEAVLRASSVDAVTGIVVFQCVIVLIVLSNAVTLLRPRRGPSAGDRPLVSVLVPARDEAANVGACVTSLLAQRYPRLEVVALDDRSTDGTRGILDAARARDARLVVLTGEEPPPGWTGKNWACHQLSLAARGDVLVFVDADTEFVAPDAVGQIVAALHASHAHLLSGLPRQRLGTAAEALIVPLFYWAFLSFTPLAIGRLVRWPPLARAVGQVMAFRRDAYAAVGGHAAIRGSVVDDLELARRIAGAGLDGRILDATGLVHCRMYRSGREAVAGFGKNLFAAFGYAILPYAFVWGWLTFVHLAPLAPWALHAALPERVPTPAPLHTVSIALAWLHWSCVYGRMRLPLWPALSYPVTMVVFLAVAIRSFVDASRRRATWKGRPVVAPPRRWL